LEATASTFVTIVVSRIESAGGFGQFHDLLVEYEASLPTRLRHGVVSGQRCLRSTYARPNAAFLASDGRDAVGCVAVTKLDAASALMVRLFVKPERRGLGIARSLVAAVIRFLQTTQYDRLVLDTDKDELRAAYDLYKSLGFAECEPYGTVDYESPTFMELSLR